MNTLTPTPRTDAATYPADCLGKTLVTNRDCARELERELIAITAKRDQLRAEIAQERAKVHILRLACESVTEEWSRNHDANPFAAGNRMMRLADTVLAATEDAK